MCRKRCWVNTLDIGRELSAGTVRFSQFVLCLLSYTGLLLGAAFIETPDELR